MLFFLLLFCFGDFESNHVMSVFSAIVFCFFFFHFRLVRPTIFTFSEDCFAVFVFGDFEVAKPLIAIF